MGIFYETNCASFIFLRSKKYELYELLKYIRTRYPINETPPHHHHHYDQTETDKYCHKHFSLPFKHVADTMKWTLVTN